MAGNEQLTTSRGTCIVSDTTAVTTLLKCDLDWLLPKMFGRILIPVAVSRELLAFHSEVPSWCLIGNVPPSDLLARFKQERDAGEAETIVLAISEKASAILLDDRQGRRRAVLHGLNCLALPDVLTAARRHGLIPSLTAAFAMLAEKGRFRVAEATAAVLLRSVGEV